MPSAKKGSNPTAESGKSAGKVAGEVGSKGVGSKGNEGVNPLQHGELKRALSSRQLQLIAIGGTIGTSLFLGTSKTISLAGPSIIIDYLIAGVVVFLTMRVLGEMLISDLRFRSFRDLVTHYLGPWGGFITGWMYWGFWIVTGMQDSVAVSVYLEDYFPGMPRWLPGLSVVLIIFLLNSVAVNVFGEMEFWLSIIKIVAIITLILVGLVMVFSGQHFVYQTVDANGLQSSLDMQSSFNNLFDYGFFGHGASGFLLGFQMAFLAYTGVEVIGTTAAEVKNPLVTLPRAINSIPLRISIFYIGTVFVILCAVPWNTIASLRGSPFVNIFTTIGIPAAGVIMTFVLITAAVSGANSGLYSTSRMLFGLSIDGHAPRAFSKTSRSQVPQSALTFGLLVIAIPVVLVTIFDDNPMDAFMIFASWSTGCILCVWILVLVSYFVYVSKHADLHNASTFKAPFGRISAGLCIAFLSFIIIIMFFDTVPRLGIILAIASLLILFAVYRFKVHKIEHLEYE
ncbi:MAG: amino acid permease [Candidatus Ancillula sp.]|jgi:D-serine/D-alanine/glycine transporter|nr:amino acid permease [Candidatus Ancillula sp.]